MAQDQDNDISRRAFVKSAATIAASAILPQELASVAARKRSPGGGGSAAAYLRSNKCPSGRWAKRV